MSEENVELVRRALEALDRRDRTAWLALHDEDFEVVPVRDFPEAGIRGSGAAFDFYLGSFDTFERVPIQVGDLVDAGADKVLFHPQMDVRGRESGADVQFDFWVVATIRQGKIIRAEWFADRAEALEAAGLSE